MAIFCIIIFAIFAAFRSAFALFGEKRRRPKDKCALSTGWVHEIDLLKKTNRHQQDAGPGPINTIIFKDSSSCCSTKWTHLSYSNFVQKLALETVTTKELLNNEGRRAFVLDLILIGKQVKHETHIRVTWVELLDLFYTFLCFSVTTRKWSRAVIRSNRLFTCVRRYVWTATKDQCFWLIIGLLAYSKHISVCVKKIRKNEETQRPWRPWCNNNMMLVTCWYSGCGRTQVCLQSDQAWTWRRDFLLTQTLCFAHALPRE